MTQPQVKQLQSVLALVMAWLGVRNDFRNWMITAA
jgi:hypothetical protein